MECIQIQGGNKLSGEVDIQGSKNAALPIMAACILVPGIVVLENCPRILDVEFMCRILRSVGVWVKWEKNVLVLDARQITESRLPREYVTRMRSSVMVAGAMLGRCREITFHYPGGCVIGDRPIDLHVKALKQLGAVFTESDDMLYAHAERLTGCRISLPFPSVGATENTVLAAVLAEGVTEIYGCAREPEIEAMCGFLNCAGAKIKGIGSSHITVEGVKQLHGCTWKVASDRIVAGTYLISTLAAGGDVYLKHAPVGQMESVLSLARVMGAGLICDNEGIRIVQSGLLTAPDSLNTGVYPAFPTDLQSILLAALCRADKDSSLTERIFNGRFGVAEELNRMGARIRVENNTAYVTGKRQLHGCNVTAQELRGGAALVLAGVMASGYTQVYNRHFIDRGYEDIVRDFKSLGVSIGSKEEFQTDERRKS